MTDQTATPQTDRRADFDGHQIPWVVRIERHEDTEKLYTLEERASKAMGDAAKELQGLDPRFADYWKQAIPWELFTMLEHYQTQASVAAAIGFLRSAHPEILSEEWR